MAGLFGLAVTAPRKGSQSPATSCDVAAPEGVETDRGTMNYTKGAWVNRLPRPLRTPAAMTGAAIMLAAVCATAVRDRFYDWLLPKDQWP